MNTAARQKLRDFLGQRLVDAGGPAELSEQDSLFLSGRLDSLAMTRLVVFLEESFQVDFAAVAFDVEMIDSLEAIETLVDAAAVQRS